MNIKDLRKEEAAPKLEVGDVVIGCSGNHYLVITDDYGKKFNLLRLENATLFDNEWSNSLETVANGLTRDINDTIIKSSTVTVSFE